MHGDPQKVLGVGRRPTVEREGDLAAYTAQAAANAIRLILVTLHDIALDGLRRRNSDVGHEQVEHRAKLRILDG